MQIQKKYKGINPDLLYEETKDIVIRHGGTIDSGKSYKESPTGGGLRGSIIANFPVEVQKKVLLGTTRERIQKEVFWARIFGMTEGVTTLIMSIDETAIPIGKAKQMEADLDFVARPYEIGLEAPAVASVPTMTYCMHCGAQIPVGTTYCSKCGEKQ